MGCMRIFGQGKKTELDDYYIGQAYERQVQKSQVGVGKFNQKVNRILWIIDRRRITSSSPHLSTLIVFNPILEELKGKRRGLFSQI